MGEQPRVEFLEEFSEIAAKTVLANAGLLDKFTGDGVMALFGVFGDADENESAKKAVGAALYFKYEFKSLLKKWELIWAAAEEQEIKLSLGCGINTGEVIVGRMGRLREQFTAVGRAVNIASRLESHSRANKILVTSKTRSRIDDVFKSVYAGTITSMKNIPGKYPYYEVIEMFENNSLRHDPSVSALQLGVPRNPRKA